MTMARVLIVEDESGVREPLTELLRLRGHEVRTAGTGRAALEIGHAFRPDVLITDWRLPNRVDGLQVLRGLTAERPGLRAIIITAHASHALRAEAAQEPSVVALLEKPFRFEELAAVLARAAPGEERHS
jgi:two-component system OmpR family response regulator